MKILFLTNSEAALPLSTWIARQAHGDAVTVHGGKLDRAELERLAPDLVVSYSYTHILRDEVLQALPQRFLNLHISLLPYNRGADPNPWSFLEDTPKGVSIHLIDKGVDTGPILVQRELRFDDSQTTLGSSYATLQDAIQELFREHWEALRSAAVVPRQQVGAGTHHFVRQFNAIKDDLLGAEGWNVPIPLFKARYARLRAAQR